MTFEGIKLPEIFDENEHQEVTLRGKLEEFRTALLHEIDAAVSNASSSAVPLINGRKIAQVGGSYQYIFDVENALDRILKHYRSFGGK